jgi:predicted ATPase
MEMMFFEDGIPREIFWSGFGLQVWMQMVLQFMRGSENSVLVLDEPDIYLYPELQIRMIDLAARRFGQIFVATHSPTIIGLADSDDVFTISAKESTAIRGLQVKS